MQADPLARQLYAGCLATLLGAGLATAGVFLNVPADYAAALALAIVGTATKDHR